MTVQLVNPEGSVINPLYHRVAIATGNTLIYMVGKVTWDEHGQFVARGDLADQVARVYCNVANWECSMYYDFAAGAEQTAPEFYFVEL